MRNPIRHNVLNQIGLGNSCGFIGSKPMRISLAGMNGCAETCTKSFVSASAEGAPIAIVDSGASEELLFTRCCRPDSCCPCCCSMIPFVHEGNFEFLIAQLYHI